MTRKPASHFQGMTTHLQYQDQGTHQIGGYGMDKIFMDGGSSMNIIIASTLQKMLIPRSVWKKSDTTLSGVVPGETATSLGAIKLEVVFGNRRNFAKRVLEFEVLDWQSQYHTI